MIRLSPVSPRDVSERDVDYIVNYPVVWSTFPEEIDSLVLQGWLRLPSPGLVYVYRDREPHPPDSTVGIARLVHWTGRRYYTTKRSFIDALVGTGHWRLEGPIGFVDLSGSFDRRTKEVIYDRSTGETLTYTKETLLAAEPQRMLWANQYLNDKRLKFNAPDIPYVAPQADAVFRMSEGPPNTYSRWQQVGLVPTEMRAGVRPLLGVASPLPLPKPRNPSEWWHGYRVFGGKSPIVGAANFVHTVAMVGIGFITEPARQIDREAHRGPREGDGVWNDWPEENRFVDGPDESSEWQPMRIIRLAPVAAL